MALDPYDYEPSAYELGQDRLDWLFDRAKEERQMRAAELPWACERVERALPHWEAEHSRDRRPHEALRIARLRLMGLASAQEAEQAAKRAFRASARIYVDAAVGEIAQAAGWCAEGNATDAMWALGLASEYIDLDGSP